MSNVYRQLARGVYLVNLSGPLNNGRTEAVIRLFREMSGQGIKRVIVNLENVPFIDGRGLAALIAGYEIFASFCLAGLQDQPRLVLELTGFDRVFQILGGLAEIPLARIPSQTCQAIVV